MLICPSRSKFYKHMSLETSSPILSYLNICQDLSQYIKDEVQPKNIVQPKNM